MIVRRTATVLAGEIKLDDPINLPDRSRVTVLIEPMAAETTNWQQAMTRLEELCRNHPVSSGGQRYLREELHDCR